jgi:putative Mn2+ efflux pump MntP
VTLGISISLDELAIGFTLGLLGLPVVPVVILIGAQALVLSQLGMRLGAHLNERVREGAERLAGVVLLGLGVGLLAGKLIA